MIINEISPIYYFRYLYEQFNYYIFNNFRICRFFLKEINNCKLEFN